MQGQSAIFFCGKKKTKLSTGIKKKTRIYPVDSSICPLEQIWPVTKKHFFFHNTNYKKLFCFSMLIEIKGGVLIYCWLVL